MRGKILLSLLIFFFLGAGLASAADMATFTFRKLYIPLGSSFSAEVLVKNVRNETDSMTVNLTGYSHARFKGLEGPIGINYIIASGGRSVTVSGLRPNRTQAVIVEVEGPNPGDFTLQLAAQSERGSSGLDTMEIAVQFPVSFSGLTDIWVLGLLVLGILVFWWRNNSH